MKQKQIAIHHTAVSRTTNKVQLYAVNRYHKEKWNMKSSLGWYVGYNFFIDSDGTITQCRSLDEETVANKGHNCDIPERCDTISVCLSGNFDQEYPSEAQNASLRRFLLERPTLSVTFHRDIQKSRRCPGRNMTHEYISSLTKIITTYEMEKAEKIKALQSQLDALRKVVDELIKIILKRK